MRFIKSDARIIFVGLFALTLCVTGTGCGTDAQVLYFVKGHDIPAAYSGFEDKRVAIVVNTESSSFGPDSLSDTMKRYLHLKLATNISSVQIVSDTEVRNWMDLNDSDGSDLVELGKAVGADLVLAVDIDDYRIRQGRTIHKGQADVEVSVVEVATGNPTFSYGPEHLEYPENGRPALNTTDRQFQVFYLSWLTERIARNFYKHDGLTDVAEDAAFAG